MGVTHNVKPNFTLNSIRSHRLNDVVLELMACTVKILKFGTPQTIAIIVLKIEKFDVTLH